MKKIISAALSVSMMLAGAVGVNADSKFTDIESVAWAAPYIEEMADMGFISGYPDGTFRPNADITHLNGVLLFARAMGSNSEAMSKVMEYAIAEYGEIVDKYELGFGKEEVCFMLYRGALTVSELDDYIAKEVRDTPLKRHEAAVIITKAMAGEKAAKAELLFDLTYEDAKDIPAKSSRYVYYVTENGIMNGVSGNLFSPNTNVKRSQIAVMLSRAVEKMGVGFFETNIKEIDSQKKIIKTDDGEFQYTDDTLMYVEGKTVKVTEIKENVAAILTVVADKLTYLDALTAIPDEEVYGVFYDYFASNDVLNIQIRKAGSKKDEYYECVEGVQVTRNGKSASIVNFKQGDYVTLKLSGGKVVSISAEQQTEVVSDAIISDISIENDLVITIEHSDAKYNGMPLNIASDVVVTKNGSSSNLSKIFRGDKVTLTIEYGQVVKIAATSTKKTLEGIIREIHITSAPSMVVEINGNEQSYDVPASVNIKINGEEGNIYGFKLGDTAKVTIESQAITSISVTSAQSSAHSITAGKVTTVNTSYGMIMVSYDDAGVTREVYVACQNPGLKIIDAAGNTKKLSEIEVGDIVTVRGTMDNGAFTASVILIESK